MLAKMLSSMNAYSNQLLIGWLSRLSRSKICALRLRKPASSTKSSGAVPVRWSSATAS
jgi:hypothetical protein